MAWRTVLRLMPMVRHSSASDGSRSPTFSSPEEIFCLMMPTSCVYSGISLSMLRRLARMVWFCIGVSFPALIALG